MCAFDVSPDVFCICWTSWTGHAGGPNITIFGRNAYVDVDVDVDRLWFSFDVDLLLYDFESRFI